MLASLVAKVLGIHSRVCDFSASKTLHISIDAPSLVANVFEYYSRLFHSFLQVNCIFLIMLTSLEAKVLGFHSRVCDFFYFQVFAYFC